MRITGVLLLIALLVGLNIQAAEAGIFGRIIGKEPPKSVVSQDTIDTLNGLMINGVKFEKFDYKYKCKGAHDGICPVNVAVELYDVSVRGEKVRWVHIDYIFYYKKIDKGKEGWFVVRKEGRCLVNGVGSGDWEEIAY